MLVPVPVLVPVLFPVPVLVLVLVAVWVPDAVDEFAADVVVVADVADVADTTVPLAPTAIVEVVASALPSLTVTVQGAFSAMRALPAASIAWTLMMKFTDVLGIGQSAIEKFVSKLRSVSVALQMTAALVPPSMMSTWYCVAAGDACQLR